MRRRVYLRLLALPVGVFLLLAPHAFSQEDPEEPNRRLYWAIDRMLNHGEGRALTSTRPPAGVPDPFAEYRRADGTVIWNRIPKDLVKREGRGFSHFAFALFLKELGPVISSGNPLRLEEFLETLTSTEFFETYGA